jgi:hypothetical protein
MPSDSNFKTAYSGVVARLDRAIQYSRDGSCLNEISRRTGCPLSRGMTIEKHTFAISPRLAREFCRKRQPSKSEGAGNAGRSMRPQPRMQNKMSIRV